MANLSTFCSAVSLARACNLPSAKYLMPVQLTAAAGFQAPSTAATQGNEHYLVLCAWTRTIKLSGLSCCWYSYGLWSPWSLVCCVQLTATVSHPRLTSKLQHSPDGAQKVPTQGAQMLLTTLLTCLYSIQFPYRGTRGHFSWTFRGCLNFMMILLLGNFLLKLRALSKTFIDFWRGTWREVLPTTKQVLHQWFM